VCGSASLLGCRSIRASVKSLYILYAIYYQYIRQVHYSTWYQSWYQTRLGFPPTHCSRQPPPTLAASNPHQPPPPREAQPSLPGAASHPPTTEPPHSTACWLLLPSRSRGSSSLPRAASNGGTPVRAVLPAAQCGSSVARRRRRPLLLLHLDRHLPRAHDNPLPGVPPPPPGRVAAPGVHPPPLGRAAAPGAPPPRSCALAQALFPWRCRAWNRAHGVLPHRRCGDPLFPKPLRATAPPPTVATAMAVDLATGSLSCPPICQPPPSGCRGRPR
jgi:hypothetical protein